MLATLPSVALATPCPSLPWCGWPVVLTPLWSNLEGPWSPLFLVGLCLSLSLSLSLLLLGRGTSSRDSGLDIWFCQIPHLLLAGVPGSVVDGEGDGGVDEVPVAAVLLILQGLIPAISSRTLLAVFPAVWLCCWALWSPLVVGLFLVIRTGSLEDPHSVLLLRHWWEPMELLVESIFTDSHTCLWRAVWKVARVRNSTSCVVPWCASWKWSTRGCVFLPAWTSFQCSRALWYADLELSPMYLYVFPWSLQVQHSTAYPIPSVVHLG